MKQYKTEDGIIEYRLPTVKEALEMMKVIAKYQSDAEKQLELLEYIIDNLHRFVTKVDFLGAKSFDELMQKEGALADVVKLAGEFSEVFNVDKKK